MFGYIVVNKEELKKDELQTYQAFYCGLCKSLYEQFGRRAQITLNFDLTFLAILLSALYEEKVSECQQRCVMHPMAKHLKYSNCYVDYAAEMTIVLTYLKCEDNWIDEHSHSSKGMMKILENRYQKIARKYPKKIQNIQNALQKIHELEQANCQNIDELAACFGKVMVEIFVMKQDEWEKYLTPLADYLGRFIYILDAYDDLEQDHKKYQFNPFFKHEMLEHFDDQVKDMLELMIAQSCDAFEMLPIFEYLNLLRNILYSGIWGKYEMARKKRLGEKDAKSI